MGLTEPVPFSGPKLVRVSSNRLLVIVIGVIISIIGSSRNHIAVAVAVVVVAGKEGRQTATARLSHGHDS